MQLTILHLLVGLLVGAGFPQDEGGPARSPKLQGFGPPWALESWYMRRQIEAPWALVGGSVVDVRTGEVRAGVDVVLAGDRIEAIGAGAAPPDVDRVDVTGRFLIPGLFDLHAHVIPRSMFFPDAPAPEEALRALLDAGVTTIRLLPFYSESALYWAADVHVGELPGPTIVPSGPIFEKEAQRTSLGFGDAATAASWVRKEALLGARWIKVYNSMDAESLRTIVDTAAEHGLRVCGHTEDVPPLEAARIGIGSIEHAISIPLSCLADGARPPEDQDLLTLTAWRWSHVDPTKASALMAAFREEGTAWVPTLVVSEHMLEEGGHDGEKLPPGELEAIRAELAAALRSAARLAVEQHRAGGLVGVGTDFPVDGVPVGTSVHRELELLVELGGATPLEALQIGTTGSARILGFEELLGTLEPGKLANLVVLGANPLESIANVRTVEAVVQDGRLYRP